MTEKDPYQDFFIQEMNRRFDELSTDIKDVRGDVQTVKSQVAYIYAFAAGVSFVFAIIFSCAKDAYITLKGVK